MQYNVLMDGALFQLVPENLALDTVSALPVCYMTKLTQAAALMCESTHGQFRRMQ